MTEEFSDHIHGGIDGEAIGDVLGAVVEGCPVTELRELEGMVENDKPDKNPYSVGPPCEDIDDSYDEQLIASVSPRRDAEIVPRIRSNAS